MKVEYTEKPRRVEATALPSGKVQLYLRESIAEVERIVDEETTVGWVADEYSLVLDYRRDLEASVEQSFDVYLAMAKRSDKSEPTTVEARVEALEGAMLAMLMGG